MTQLAPNLFERRFQDFLDLGRARLPSLAPEWTDHNAHDPGIMLMELLAWVAEAQLYSLSRTRRDERAGYAALLGVAPRGTQSASGLIWPERSPTQVPASTSFRSVVLEETEDITPLDGDGHTFRPVQKILWTPGRIKLLETRRPTGRTTDHTATNSQGGMPFLPFGERAGRRDVLALTFEASGSSGFFGADRDKARGARWAIGVVAAPPAGSPKQLVAASPTAPSPLAAMLVTDDDEYDIPIVWDTTQGFLKTGVVLLDLDCVKTLPDRFTLELSARKGSPRPPRVLRIDPNVIPIVQGQLVVDEGHRTIRMPDWELQLEERGLRFGGACDPFTVVVAEGKGRQTWERRDRLSECGPDDPVYALDAPKGRIVFGNGINGRMLPADAEVLVTYAVSDGENGRVARNRKWRVPIVPDILGVNIEAIGGGSAAPDGIDQRRTARQHARQAQVLVSAADLVSAAKELSLLEVARAWAASPGRNTPRTGVTSLVVLRQRPVGYEQEPMLETPRWLDAIRRALAPRVPLGSRLKVIAPEYVTFRIEAVVVAESGRNPTVVAEDVRKSLRERLALVDSSSKIPPREPGVPISSGDVWAWVRSVDGVKHVAPITLRTADGQVATYIKLSRNGLPWWNAERSTIDVQRPEPGRPQ